ncbi:hypothetical protein [Dyella sp.]|uniref:hypothetical protein n=1 Tax=Dyella sp. TaxID=1869338 RepID=UPI002B48EC22|nr:hypothetical protein [Dyella sp.]HKT30541.1 hypothetical protein [Dyella sp.]
MFRKPFGFAAHIRVITIAFAAVLSTSALAQAPTTGLGQAWPNAADVSVSPHYHVYVFTRDGIRYVQINDLNGTVRAAVAMADNVVLVLPVGVDAAYVTTQRGTASGNAGLTETIYSDSTTRITATVMSTGALQINVATTPVVVPNICTNPVNCSNAAGGGNGG